MLSEINKLYGSSEDNGKVATSVHIVIGFAPSFGKLESAPPRRKKREIGLANIFVKISHSSYT